MAGVNTDGYEGWNLIEKGYKVALLKKDNIALVRIKDFVYFKGTGGGLRCEDEASDSTMCSDVRILRQALKSIENNVDYLIIDLQGNGGGNENSPLVAEFAQTPFYDLSVQFRKTRILEDKAMRNRLFYTPMEHKWYEKIHDNGVYDSVAYGAFLPARADFCRGSEECELKPIDPNGHHTGFKKFVILTNQTCVSSCDDFVWRLQSYGNAIIIGQEQAADATYSRIGVVIYKDSSGTIQSTYTGERGEESAPGLKLCKMVIPYSKTVNKNGSLRQGQAAKLDLTVYFDHTELPEIETKVLNTAVEYLRNNP